MELICIDLEASGLGEESYPIEVAWKNDVTGEQDSFLIDPDTAQNWHYWDEYAEEMHGIERCQLNSKGLDIITACRRLNEKLKDKTLVSDAWEFDLFWLTRLFDETGMKPTFTMIGLERILSKEQRMQFRFLARAQSRKHRALEDVEDIIACIKAVTYEAGA